MNRGHGIYKESNYYNFAILPSLVDSLCLEKRKTIPEPNVSLSVPILVQFWLHTSFCKKNHQRQPIHSTYPRHRNLPTRSCTQPIQNTFSVLTDPRLKHPFSITCGWTPWSRAFWGWDLDPMFFTLWFLQELLEPLLLSGMTLRD
jgi:hypothetical protein